MKRIFFSAPLCIAFICCWKTPSYTMENPDSDNGAIMLEHNVIALDSPIEADSSHSDGSFSHYEEKHGPTGSHNFEDPTPFPQSPPTWSTSPTQGFNIGQVQDPIHITIHRAGAQSAQAQSLPTRLSGQLRSTPSRTSNLSPTATITTPSTYQLDSSRSMSAFSVTSTPEQPRSLWDRFLFCCCGLGARVHNE